MNEDSSFVKLAVYDSESEATLAQAILEENNIHANVSGLEPSALGIALDGDDAIELFVLEADLDRARKLVQDLEKPENQEPIPAWTCKCGEDVDQGFFVCWSCGAEYIKP